MPTSSSPRFSIITPVFETPRDVLEAALQSVRQQTNPNWEHCLVNDGSSSPHVASILDEAAAADPRVRVLHRSEQGGIVAASNDAIAMARGEFVGFLDHDDELRRDALELVETAIDAHDDVDYVYTDEDKIDEHGRHYMPFLKPDWSPERLRGQMYTCHFGVMRKSLVDEVGRLRPGYDGSQDWDLALRLTERARRVVHVPQILYHWRAIESSAAGDIQAKPYAHEAGLRAVNDHLARIGYEATADEVPGLPGHLRIRPALTENPLVSIIIPTAGSTRRVHGDETVLVEFCVETLLGRSSYHEVEVVIVADPSVTMATRDKLKQIGGDRLRIVPYEKPFNFAEKINLGVLRSYGDYLVFLNDDTEIITADWIEGLLLYALDRGVGSVGSRLLYPDGRLQHVGIVCFDGRPVHPYTGFPGTYFGAFGNVVVPGNYLALTAACLMTRRDCFTEVGGLSPQFPINYNDVDFGFKLHEAGYRNVYNPDVVLTHHESATRQPVVAEDEMRRLEARWQRLLDQDPYYNPAFVPTSPHFLEPAFLSDGRLVGASRRGK